jgi:CP family cyanate transporter-like MFS transporter
MRNPFPLVLVFAACFVAGYVGLMVAPLDGTALWIVFIGTAPSAFPLVLTLLNVRTRTSAGAASLSGFVQGVGYAIAGVGPLLVGVLVAATGGWTAGYVFLLATVVVFVLAGVVACRPAMLEDTWGPRGPGPSRRSGGSPDDPATDPLL